MPDLAFKRYNRPFQQPLRRAQQPWRIRQGYLVRLSDAGRVGYGEIAPLSWFGSETTNRIYRFCLALPKQIDWPDIERIPADLPATRFGLECAWEALHADLPSAGDPALCGLLPSGSVALEQWRILWEQGFRTLKWKIGNAPFEQEAAIFQALLKHIPPAAKLRLDANGRLSPAEAQAWIALCRDAPVEFLEQPLPPARFEGLSDLQAHSPLPIGLDESVATLPQLEQHREWPGILVVKPAIVGSVAGLRRFCQQTQAQLVFSSAFETAVGCFHGARLAHLCQRHAYAIGFGIGHHFGSDGLNFPEAFSASYADLKPRFDWLWNSIP